MNRVGALNGALIMFAVLVARNVREEAMVPVAHFVQETLSVPLLVRAVLPH
jgi:hypothetical protein